MPKTKMSRPDPTLDGPILLLLKESFRLFLILFSRRQFEQIRMLLVLFPVHTDFHAARPEEFQNQKHHGRQQHDPPRSGYAIENFQDYQCGLDVCDQVFNPCHSHRLSPSHTPRRYNLSLTCMYLSLTYAVYPSTVRTYLSLTRTA